jgi:DNA-binding CsgD family transcriptional regulator
VDPVRRETMLAHIGIIRRSGRYPWGSGGEAYQSASLFKIDLDNLRSQGLSDPQIAQALGLSSTTQLRDTITKTTEIIRAQNQATAVRLKTKDGMSTRAIAKEMLGDPNKESTIRGWLKTADAIKDKSIEAIANLLRGHQAEKEYVDVGRGNEHYLGISDVRLRAAVASLKDEGYEVWNVKFPQLGTDKLTEMKILSPPGSTWKDARDAVNSGLVYTMQDKSLDGGLSFIRPKADPVSLSSKRLAIRYGEDGGGNMDGIIEVRRGVSDLDLGKNSYAQVRVAVDGTHYLKGMAMYADDLPAGTDIRYNTPKSKSTPMIGPKDNSVLKPLKEGPENAGNRFGAITRPHVYKDENGNVKTSALNMVNEEGDWDKWSNNLSSQMLSKQSIRLAATQLNEARKYQQEELDKIMALTNPVVKKKMLLDFAEGADSAATHLKAAALPRQSTHVILPMNSMRPNEVYAPNFNNGERVALVRHPHGGPFEIPQLTVNNKNTTAKRLMGGATDGIGIHPSVAKVLSGADFDGDTVVVIPNDSGKVKSKQPLTELENFDPKIAYPSSPGMTKMTSNNTQKEMGKISNLITDMTIKGAKTSEIARAVKHSMVVIDAEKHELDYKLSEKDNGVAQLKATYQGGANKGSSTIISRAKSPTSIPQVRPRRQSEGGPINPKTGELETVPTGKTYTVTKTSTRTGAVTTKVVTKQTRLPAMQVVKDARKLSSGEPMEEVYANYANSMKAMANTARKSAVAIKDPTQSTAAKALYSKEVTSLRAKLKNAQMNAPLERRAQIVAGATAKARIATRVDPDKDEIKKIKYESLRDAREQTGAAKQRIGSKLVPLLPREWEAIQAGAVSTSMLTKVLDNSDMDAVRKLATPTYRSSLTPGQLALAKSMNASGRSPTEIAAALGIPRSTIVDNLANG